MRRINKIKQVINITNFIRTLTQRWKIESRNIMIITNHGYKRNMKIFNELSKTFFDDNSYSLKNSKLKKQRNEYDKFKQIQKMLISSKLSNRLISSRY